MVQVCRALLPELVQTVRANPTSLAFQSELMLSAMLQTAQAPKGHNQTDGAKATIFPSRRGKQPLVRLGTERPAGSLCIKAPYHLTCLFECMPMLACNSIVILVHSQALTRLPITANDLDFSISSDWTAAVWACFQSLCYPVVPPLQVNTSKRANPI